MENLAPGNTSSSWRHAECGHTGRTSDQRLWQDACAERDGQREPQGACNDQSVLFRTAGTGTNAITSASALSTSAPTSAASQLHTPAG